METPASERVRLFWPPLLASVGLGLVLLLTFLLTGLGRGALGFVTRWTAWLGVEVAPSATQSNEYLGPLVTGGNPLPSRNCD